MMTNLLKADLLKLKKDKPVRVIVIILLAVNLFSMGIFKLMAVIIPPEAGMDEMMAIFGEFSFYSLFSLSSLGLLIAVALSIFVGKDFSQNTIRGKVIAGNSRLKIYLSTLCINLIVGLALLAITVIEGTLLGLIFYGVSDNAGQMVQILSLYLVLYIGFIAVMTFISMAVKTPTMGIVLNILIVVVLPSLLMLVSTINTTALGGNKVIEFLLSICPYQLAQAIAGTAMITETGVSFAVAVNATLVVKTVVSSLILLLLATAGGYFIFRKADLK